MYCSAQTSYYFNVELECQQKQHAGPSFISNAIASMQAAGRRIFALLTVAFMMLLVGDSAAAAFSPASKPKYLQATSFAKNKCHLGLSLYREGLRAS